ncbi:hypothetical protein AB0H00_16720 [Nocardia sp. NPDC023852]
MVHTTETKSVSLWLLEVLEPSSKRSSSYAVAVLALTCPMAVELGIRAA